MIIQIHHFSIRASQFDASVISSTFFKNSFAYADKQNSVQESRITIVLRKLAGKFLKFKCPVIFGNIMNTSSVHTRSTSTTK